MPERFTPKPGVKILYPLYDANGVLLIQAGAEITKRLVDVLDRRGILFDLNAELEVVQGGRVGTRIPLKRPTVTIGRANACEVRPNDPCISQRHCRIRKFAGSVLLADLQSTNGTLLNGQRIEEPTELCDGDQVQVGRFIFSVEIFADVAAQTPDDQRAIDSLVLDEAARIPNGGPTLFSRDNCAPIPCES